METWKKQIFFWLPYITDISKREETAKKVRDLSKKKVQIECSLPMSNYCGDDGGDDPTE